jgi:hypothetical protein
MSCRIKVKRTNFGSMKFMKMLLQLIFTRHKLTTKDGPTSKKAEGLSAASATRRMDFLLEARRRRDSLMEEAIQQELASRIKAGQITIILAGEVVTIAADLLVFSVVVSGAGKSCFSIRIFLKLFRICQSHINAFY